MIIYVSYCARDIGLVEPLVVQLGLLGHGVQFEYKTLLGELSWEAVATGIRECDVFLLALTPNSLVSYSRGAEHQYASALGRPLITALMAVVEEKIPPAITNIINLRELDEESVDRFSWALDSLPPAQPPAQPFPTLEWAVMLERLSEQIALGQNSTLQQAGILLNIEEFLQRRETFDTAESMLAVFGTRQDLFDPVRDGFDAVVAELALAKRRRARGRWRAVLIGGILLSAIVAVILLLRLRDASRAPAPLSVNVIGTAVETEDVVVPTVLPILGIPSTTPRPSSTPIPSTAAPLSTNTTTAATATARSSSMPNSTRTGRTLGESVYVGLTVEDSADGIVVTDVGMTAAAAGIQVGDIVLAVDLQDVLTAEQFYTLLNARNPFARVNLRLRRSGIMFAPMILGVSDYAVPTPPQP